MTIADFQSKKAGGDNQLWDGDWSMSQLMLILMHKPEGWRAPGLSESQTPMCAVQTLVSHEFPKLGAEIVQAAEPPVIMWWGYSPP